LNNPLNVGIIGCGNITLNEHAPALKALDGVRVTAIADLVPARREKVRALLGLADAAGFADYRALLASGVDYVTLTVPQKFRRPIIEDCAKAGVHVLTEKPIATTPADAQAMMAVMRAANLRYGMVHNYLFYPEYVLARELAASGALGTLRHVTLNFLGMPDHPGAAEYRPQWRHDPAEAGGGVLMDMVHVLYLAEFFMGGPIRAVTAIVDNLDHPGEAVEDFTLVNCHFDTGYATVQLWWGGGPNGLEIGGTHGRILIFYQNYATGPFTALESFTLVNREGRREYQPRGGKAASNNFTQIHADFADAIRAGREPVASAEAGLRSLEAALAAYLSGATGRTVSLPLAPDHPVYARGVLGLRELPLWDDSPLVKRGVFGLPAARP
jgi:predicted dehydrogenase